MGGLLVRKINLVGQTFGFLTVLKSVERVDANKRYLCLCVCGLTTKVRSHHLRSGAVISCGCKKGTHPRCQLTQDGQSHTAAYRSWTAMWKRCTKTHYHAYHRYGGRGIKVCERWKNFLDFLADMGQPPSGCWLDRKNNNGDYTPENCKWSTPTESANNRG